MDHHSGKRQVLQIDCRLRSGTASCFFIRIMMTHLFQLIFVSLFAQQLVDTSFRLPEFNPAYAEGKGPVVLVDQHHNNLQVKEGNYDPLFALLKKDGYRIKNIERDFTNETLKLGSILVIINAIADYNVDNWALPVYPAISAEEDESIYSWVLDGGSLFLVADHMPFPAATELLARKFGVFFSNGFAIDTVSWDPLEFKKTDQTLLDHPIIRGRNSSEKIDSIKTFWGQAFQCDKNKVKGFFRFTDNTVSYNPDTAWRFRENTPVIPVKNWYQGAAGTFGKGRVVILGEAGMLTAQVTGPKNVKMGMNATGAEENFQFILNTLHWLAFLISEN